MLVAKITTLITRSLTTNQLKQLHASLLTHNLNHHLSDNLQDTNLHATSLIRTLCNNGNFQQAYNLYTNMHRLSLTLSTFTVACCLKACARARNRDGGIMIHCQVFKYGFCGDVYVDTSLLGFYAKLGEMASARRLFDGMSRRNVVSWNTMVDGYLRVGELAMAEMVFGCVWVKDVVSWNSMVSGYLRGGDLEKALRLFREMPVRNQASWNAMVSGYVECGKLDLARSFYDSMPERNSISCITMIGGYAKCGDVVSAREVFSEMGRKDCLLYNAMIACYAKNSQPKEALELFSEMLQPNVSVQPDKMTLATVISACSQLGDLSFGTWIHEHYMNQIGIAMDDHLLTALIDLYAKCGSIDKAFKLFHKLQTKDVVAYTAMILGCGINGKERVAIKLFDEMMESKIRPNLVTFSGLLTALSHVGMVAESYHCFNSMKRYGLVPTPDHYSLMVEILGRAGRLEEAHNLIKSMPIQPHAGVWGALLLACSTHNNVELGEVAAKHCFDLEPDSSGYGSLLANIYASVGRWEDAKMLRKSIHEKGLVKVPGSSWMDHVETKE